MSGRATTHVLYGESGHRYELGRELAAGGEGSVREVVDAPDLVAKLPTFARASGSADPEEQLLEKIGTMLGRRPGIPRCLPDDVEHVYWAWPRERLRSDAGRFAGFLMPRIRGVKGEEFLQFGSGHAWDVRLDAARTLARLVVATHEAGFVIGDLNPRNMFFTPRARAAAGPGGDCPPARVLPSLIDTDSFQVGEPATGAVLFECLVQNPEYSAPELVLGEARTRTTQQDSFTLAIVMFQLLALGLHPYSGVAKGSPNREIRGNIAQRRSLVVSDALVRPRGSIDLEVFPPRILSMFRQTFGPGQTVTRARASASEWAEAIERELAERTVSCAKVAEHRFGAHLSVCPWCEYADRWGVDPFSARGVADAPSRVPRRPQVLDAKGAPAARAARGPSSRPSSRVAAAPRTLGGDDTIFGPVPEAWRRPNTAAGTIAPRIAAPRPAATEASHGGGKRPAIASSPRPPAGQGPLPGGNPSLSRPSRKARRLRSIGRNLVRPMVAVLAVAGFGGLLFAVGTPDVRDLLTLPRHWIAGVAAVIGRDAQAAEPTAIPIYPEEPAQGSYSLTIELCVADRPAIACSEATRAPADVDLAVIGRRGTELRGWDTLDGMRVYNVRGLPTGRYTIRLLGIGTERLEEAYRWCDGRGPAGVGPERAFTIPIEADRTLPLVLCAA